MREAPDRLMETARVLAHRYVRAAPELAHHYEDFVGAILLAYAEHAEEWDGSTSLIAFLAPRARGYVSEYRERACFVFRRWPGAAWSAEPVGEDEALGVAAEAPEPEDVVSARVLAQKAPGELARRLVADGLRSSPLRAVDLLMSVEFGDETAVDAGRRYGLQKGSVSDFLRRGRKVLNEWSQEVRACA